MNYLQIQKAIKEIAEKVKFGQIHFTEQGISSYISFDNVEYYEEESLVFFSYRSDSLEGDISSFCIDITDIEDITAIENENGEYEISIYMNELNNNLELFITLPEKQIFTNIKLIYKIEYISIDQLFDILSKHETGFFIDINNRDLMRNDCFNLEFQSVYFTNVMSINNNRIIAFTNEKQAPISNKNGTKLYHQSFDTSLYIDSDRINSIEKEDTEDYITLSNTPLKAVYNIYLQENADGVEDIVTVGLI